MDTVLRWMVRHQRAVRVFLALIYGLVLGALRIRWDLPFDMMLVLIIFTNAKVVPLKIAGFLIFKTIK